MKVDPGRIIRVVQWLQQATTEWAQQQGGYPADIAPVGNYVVIASIECEKPVLEVYILEQAEYAIDFAERHAAETKMIAFGDGAVEWVDKDLNKYLEESN
jgi:hypothetical protein